MSQFSQKNMAGNIRSLLAINSTDLPKLQPIETLLWSAVQNALVNADDLIVELGKLFKSTLNNRLYSNLACVIDKSSRVAKLKRAFEELPWNGSALVLNCRTS